MEMHHFFDPAWGHTSEAERVRQKEQSMTANLNEKAVQDLSTSKAVDKDFGITWAAENSEKKIYSKDLQELSETMDNVRPHLYNPLSVSL